MNAPDSPPSACLHIKGDDPSNADADGKSFESPAQGREELDTILVYFDTATHTVRTKAFFKADGIRMLKQSRVDGFSAITLTIDGSFGVDEILSVSSVEMVDLTPDCLQQVPALAIIVFSAARVSFRLP